MAHLIMNFTITLYKYFFRIWAKIKSWLCVLDLKLKGASIPWKVQINGRVDILNAKNLIIGKGVKIGKNVKITASTATVRIGNNCIIANNVRLDPLGGKGIVLGDYVILNTSVIITAWAHVAVGQNSQIAPFCHITDRNHGLSKNVMFRQQKGSSSPIIIGQDVWIASSCVIIKGAMISNGAVVGANSVVNKSVPSWQIVAGSPIRVIGEKK